MITAERLYYVCLNSSCISALPPFTNSHWNRISLLPSAHKCAFYMWFRFICTICNVLGVCSSLCVWSFLVFAGRRQCKEQPDDWSYILPHFYRVWLRLIWWISSVSFIFSFDFSTCGKRTQRIIEKTAVDGSMSFRGISHLKMHLQHSVYIYNIHIYYI